MTLHYFMPLIQIDKLWHLIVSFALLLFFFIIRVFVFHKKTFLEQFSFSIRDVLFVGLSKEIFDTFGFGDAEILDFFADFFGVILPLYIYFLYIESKKMADTQTIHYELKLFKKLQNRTSIFLRRLYYFIWIRYKLFFYKKTVFLYIPDNINRFLLRKYLEDLIFIAICTMKFAIVWIFNLAILVVKVPLVTLFNTTKSIYWLMQYFCDLNRKDLKHIKYIQ